jgi:hypothetical protein
LSKCLAAVSFLEEIIDEKRREDKSDERGALDSGKLHELAQLVDDGKRTPMG